MARLIGVRQVTEEIEGELGGEVADEWNQVVGGMGCWDSDNVPLVDVINSV